jgi:DNA-binding HxlR family transcriptional regulator
MQRTSLATIPCSIARTVDLAAEWWTPLIVRDIYLGLQRFDEIQRNLGISRKVLAERLERLVNHEVLKRNPYREHPPRYEYVLTEKGEELVQAFFALMAWGDRWTAGDTGPPMLLRHDQCGKLATPEVTCSHCGGSLTAASVTPEPGPGARVTHGTRELARLFGRPLSPL